MLFVVLPLAWATAATAAPPAGKLMKSDDGNCQMRVPGDWSSSYTGGMGLPGSRSHVFLYQQEESLPARREIIARTGQVEKTFEDSASRYWVEIRSHSDMRAWNVVVPASGGDCYAEITFDSKLSEADAKTIALSVQQQAKTT